MSLGPKQSLTLGVQPREQQSPYLAMCCLRMCAKASYQQAETDIAMLTGIRVSAKTQERMVKRSILPDPVSDEPVQELALDGGMVRVLTPKGKVSEWRQYHAIRVNRDGIGMAWFKQPKALLSWILTRPMATLVYLLGDGHPGIWSLFGQMNIASLKDEILDWFHLKENLYNVEAAPEQLETLSSHLWAGQVGQANAVLKDLQTPSAKRFRAYLDQHSQRIPNYRYYQMEGLPIGSGPVESLIKQVDARLQLTGAQWNTESLPQMLKLRWLSKQTLGLYSYIQRMTCSHPHLHPAALDRLRNLGSATGCCARCYLFSTTFDRTPQPTGAGCSPITQHRTVRPRNRP